MKNRNQRDIFLESEGDAWYKRNIKNDKESKLWSRKDPLIEAIKDIPLENNSRVKVLEVGCGQGLRIKELQSERGWTGIGLDPSKEAIASVKRRGCIGFVGTADSIPMNDKSVDLLIFGFCLYLCDREDLFKIAAEAHRVLRPKSWLAILDFWTPNPKKNQQR